MYLGSSSGIDYGIFNNDCGSLCTTLKGQSNEIFDPQFFSSFEPAGATYQWVKIVSFLVSFSPRYSNIFESMRSIILRGVM